MAVKLLPHNEETYANMIKMFETDQRVAVVQPTGTGKSFLALKWIEDNMKDDILVLSPSYEIFYQLNKYANNSNLDISHLKTCIYQNLLNYSDEKLSSLNFNKIILDEFHRTGATEWNKKVNVLLENPNTQILGLTATPIRYLDKSRDMSSEIFNGNFARYMNLGEAVEMGLLPVPTYVPVWYEDDNTNTYNEYIDNTLDTTRSKKIREYIKSQKRNLENSYGAENIFKKFMPTNHGKYIVFCTNKDHLYKMEKQLKIWLKKVNTSIKTYITLSDRSDKESQVKSFIEDYDDTSIRLLFSIDRISEGVHVPGLEGIIMLRPTESPIIYLQQIGRALSTNTVESPLIFDMVNNYLTVRRQEPDGKNVNVFEKEIYESAKRRGTIDKDAPCFRIFEMATDFNKIIHNLEYTLSWQYVWDENFELLKMFINEFGRLPLEREKYNEFGIGRWVKYQRVLSTVGSLSKEREEKLKSLGISLTIPKLEEQWSKHFELLKMFIDEFGRLPKTNEIYYGFNIGIWISNQKVAANKDKLSKERQDLLESIGMIFVNIPDKIWDENFELLKMFINEFGRLPKQAEKYHGKRIGQWFHIQKKYILKGTLSKDKEERLKSLSVSLEINIKSEQWNKHFELLKMFIDEFGRLPKTNEIYYGFNIGHWRISQKTLYNKGKLSKERQELLESVGALINIITPSLWYENFELLKMFINEFGRLPKQAEKYHGKRIGEWLNTQKVSANKGKLSKERQELLESIGVVFSKKEEE